MTKYQCIKRLTTDGHATVHEVGDIVSLSDADAQSVLKQGAVVAVSDETSKSIKGPKTPPDGGDAA